MLTGKMSTIRLSLLLAFIGFGNIVHAQDFGVASSTLHDDNIFDIYAPIPDQVTQLQLDASNDWDFEKASLSLGYTGSLLFFRDVSSRNYHVHLISLTSSYHFISDTDDETDSEDDSTTTDGEATLGKTAYTDSSDQFLYASLIGGSQFNGQAFSEYDNTKISGTVTLRQPFGSKLSVRPSYTFSFHSYPNLSGITNIQNTFMLHLGSDVISGSWLSISPSYSIKSYPISSSYSYTFTTQNPSGHGKRNSSGVGQTRTRTFLLTAPAVRQLSMSVGWKQRINEGSIASGTYTHFGTPTSEARAVPLQLGGGLEARGVVGEFASQNEIFDDHFAFSGNELTLQFEQTLPLLFILDLNLHFQKKTYSSAAMDLADSLILAPNRIDARTEVEIAVSKRIRFSQGVIVKPHLEYHYVRNNSNAPYYEFDKNAIAVGLELNF